MRVESKNLVKEINIIDGKITSACLLNKITGKSLMLENYSEFKISYFDKNKKKQLNLITSNDFLANENGNTIEFAGKKGENDWNIRVNYYVDEKSQTIKKYITLKTDNDVNLDYICLDEFDVTTASFKWTIPPIKDRVYVPDRIFVLGQPYYVQDMFFGGEYPTCENKISNDTASAKYFLGRTFDKIATDGEYKSVEFVVGAGIGDRFDMLRSSFFKYTETFAQPSKFRVQFNSWYDYMLDIDSEKIEKSFTEVATNMKEAGFRPLDCYVIDDGWTDYKVSKLWDFDKKHFANEFNKESELTKKLDSTFGVWFGPRGGYTTQTVKYARLLKKIGYGYCRQSYDICTGDPRYVKDLTDKMAEFCQKYNATYFKIDGFACTPCKSSKHGHPKGEGDGIYFYTFLWEQWLKGFEKIRKVQPDVFLNITSYSHPSPWFLKWVNAMWLNNCGDMNYVGKGSDLDQCLNYRDGRYRDFFETRQLQFPVSYIYNHEPCYAERNYNPPLPAKSHKTVKYTYEEFEKYMYVCMMRGTRFVELYFSPSMFDKKRWKIAADVLNWAEENFDIIKNSQFFGGEPKDETVYGYYAKSGDKAIVMLRNSSAKEVVYGLDNAKLSFDDADYYVCEYYPTKTTEKKVSGKGECEITLAPYQVKILYVDFIR